MEAEERFNKRTALVRGVTHGVSGAVYQDVREVAIRLYEEIGGRALKITMNPDEARHLAHSLINTADSTDRLAGDEPTT